MRRSKIMKNSRQESSAPFCKGDTHGSAHLACSLKADGKPPEHRSLKQNLGHHTDSSVHRSLKQNLGHHTDSSGDQKHEEEAYREKYLSRKIMSFQWSEANTSMPEKSDLLKLICHRIQNNVSPDVTVRVKDRKFACHSIVLFCYIDLSEDVKYARKEIVLDATKVSYETFRVIYAWMLAEPERSHLKLTRDNVLQLLEAAKYLGVLELADQCWAFINSDEMFSEATAFFLYLNAKTSLCPESREPIMQLMLPRVQRFFLVLVSSKNWIELDSKDVCAFLSSNYTRVRCELEIFMSAVRWLHYDWDARQQHVVQVMQCVRFGLMSPFQLVEIRSSAEFKPITSLSGVQKLITEGIDIATVKSAHSLLNHNETELSQVFGLREPHPRQYLQHENRLYQNHNHIYRDFLIQLNKIKEGEIILNNDDANATSGGEPIARLKSVNSPAISKKSKSNAKTKEIHSEKPRLQDGKTDKLEHMVNGSGNRINNVDTAGTDFLMELSSRNLKKLNDINRERENHLGPKSTHLGIEKTERKITERTESSVFMEESEAILVFGGIDQNALQSRLKKTGREIHRYNPFVNTWQLIGEMPVARYHHCTVYHNGLVYLAGGIDWSKGEKTPESISNSVWSFNPSSKQWTAETPMQHPRRNFSLIACKDKIYAIGGQDSQAILSSVECYDPATRVWHEVAPLRVARMAVAAAEVSGKIWIAGGFIGGALNEVSDQVECYDPSSNRWSTVTPKLRYPRYMATLVCVNNEKLYLIGGATRADSPHKMYSVSDLDVLDVAEVEKEWRCVTELVVPRHAHTADILSSQILIIGGVTTVYNKTLQSIECWCFHRQAWITGVSGLPQLRLGHSSVALPLKS